jgi:hypothetical protein
VGQGSGADQSIAREEREEGYVEIRIELEKSEKRMW